MIGETFRNFRNVSKRFGKTVFRENARCWQMAIRLVLPFKKHQAFSKAGQVHPFCVMPLVQH